MDFRKLTRLSFFRALGFRQFIKQRSQKAEFSLLRKFLQKPLISTRDEKTEMSELMKYNFFLKMPEKIRGGFLWHNNKLIIRQWQQDRRTLSNAAAINNNSIRFVTCCLASLFVHF